MFTSNRNAVVYTLAIVAALVVAVLGVNTAQADNEPMTKAEHRIAFVEEGGGDAIWGDKACNMLRYTAATVPQVTCWFVNDQGLTMDQALTVMSLSEKHLCPSLFDAPVTSI